VSLSSSSGSTCSSSAVTVTGNTFGGSATNVSLSEDGAGTLNISSASSSPFSFTYTPAAGDAGNTVTITVTTNNPNGSPCVAATATYSLTVKATPATPGITQSNDTLYSSTLVVGASYEWYLGASLVQTTSTPYYKIPVGGSYTVKVIKDGCPSATSATFSATLVGIRNSTNSIKVFEVYPNPTNDILTIKSSGIENGIYKLVLRNIIGQILFSDEINATNSVIEKTISISTLANDIYFLSIENTNGVIVKKILKQE
jgi:hypothetical protein